jgi:hypothetical protein
MWRYYPCITPHPNAFGDRGQLLLLVQTELFLQSDRDQLAEPALLHQMLETPGPRAMFTLFADADHSFHVPVRSGRTDEQTMGTMMDVLAA